MSTSASPDVNKDVENGIVKERIDRNNKSKDIMDKSNILIDIEILQNTLEERSVQLEKWHKELINKASELEVEKIKCQQQQIALDEKVKTAEQDIKLKITTEYAEAKSKLLDEQAKSRSDFINEIDRKRSDFEKNRQKAFSDLAKELENTRTEVKKELDELRKCQDIKLENERECILKEFQKQRDEQKAKLKEQREFVLQQLEFEISERTERLTKGESSLSSAQERVNNENSRLVELEKNIEKREVELLDERAILEREKRRLNREKLRIEEIDSNLTEVVNKRIDDTIKNLNQVIDTKNKELDSLREQLSTRVEDIEVVNSFNQVYGENPHVVIQEMKQLQATNQMLKDKLSNSADKAEMDNLSAAYRESKNEVDRLLEENRHLYESQSKVASIEAQLRALDTERKSLLATCESLENQLQEKNDELVRLSTPEGRIADRDARIATIMTGTMDDKKDLIGAGEGLDSRFNKKDEITWLEDVWKKCREYGIKFNKRILYAFHTALKINEWSTITVLAGVSGTGKSELPRLYSEFGGLNFCSVSVQPNWDSQESMLGFFNSIDNQFEPEELLKFLAQCISDPRYNEYMSVILLDEMNLAHVEHYFAEFLSKLESRRGLSRSYLPEIEVKLGAGVKPYGLKLSRTLLWTGTMNQDETTKSLSDKVLDRGIVINFPRPKSLVSRTKMGLITDYISDDRAKLHKDTWQSWTSHTIDFSEEQMKEIEIYRSIVQSINNVLEDVGRALGHRVWQSIEYYIANYPTVRKALNYQPIKNEKGKITWCPSNNELTGSLKEAMKTAFEDQIVQKIMPKLRGIETRDKRGKSSLDKIEALLVTHDFTNLQADFQIAREQGYGQFIWSSAKYLDDNDEKEIDD